jgi:hypothetical protein
MTDHDTSRFDGEAVAAYETVHGAWLAEEQLANAGFTGEDVDIVPVATRPLPGWEGRIGQRTHPMSVVLATLLGFSVAAAAMFGWTSSSVTIAAFVALLGGAVFGGLTLLVDAQWAARVRGRASAERRVVAQRFEVRCCRDASHARHVLARWWNPAAVPAGPADRG